MTSTFWQQQRAELYTAVKLASWSWRQQWLLLLTIGLGILTAATLICSLPLFSSTIVTAGLRTTLRATPGNTMIEASVSMSDISSPAIAEATSRLNARVQKSLSPYLASSQQLTQQIEVGDWITPSNGYQVALYGASMHDASSHLQMLQGHLPDDENVTSLDVALTSSVASSLGVKVGADISLLGPVSIPSTNIDDPQPQIYSQTLTLHVVGIFHVLQDDPYWYGRTFETTSSANVNSTRFYALISSSSLLHSIDAFAKSYSTRGIGYSHGSSFFLSYTLAPDKIQSDQLADLLQRLGQLQADVAQPVGKISSYSPATFPYVGTINLTGATLHNSSGPQLLDMFQNQLLLSQATVFILTLQIAGLILFFVSTLASTLVERQISSIALLRSRGASQRQMLGTLLMQGLVLCLLAGIVAPGLALLVVEKAMPLLLSAKSMDALNVLPDTPLKLVSSTGLYALGALLITLGTLYFTFSIALRENIVTLRRETARSTRRPLWQRWRLDLVFTALALAGYGFAYYAQNTQQFLDEQTRLLLLTPISLLASLPLLLAGLLLFLRIFPVLLRMLLRITRRRRGLVSMLAVAHLERTPHQPLRTTLLLGLALSFGIFTLTFAASQAQRSQDLASYQASADFSGYLPASLQVYTSDPTTIAARYRTLPGVTSASAGYIRQAFIQGNPGSPDQYFRPLQLQAIDVQSFAQTVSWPPQISEQSPANLLTQLAAMQAQAQAQKAVPAILSSSAWQILHLHTGEIFSLFNTSGQQEPVRYLAVSSVAHIPPVDESQASGMLVDFASLSAALQKSSETPLLNYAWLRTSDNPALLTSLRQTLNTSSLALGSLSDQRAMAQTNAANPVVLNMLAIAGLGGMTALLLALLANLLLPVLTMRARLTNLAFLRALGSAPEQIGRMLAWEQILVVTFALIMGSLFGFLLALIAVPPLVVSGVPLANTQQLAAGTAYSLQSLLPARLVLPPSLFLALAGLVILCLVSLALVIQIALRPTLGQQLRLNED
ncbi:MAG TPA: FtsX-like permease family protein [Ktedonobacteraceae bacterium]|nr:FtsX-like permease family protein [Ktedonobacteraceae bacterium]